MWMVAGLSLIAPTLCSLSDDFSIPTFFISHSRPQWCSHKKNPALLAVCLQPAAKSDALWELAHGCKRPVLTLWVWMMLLYSRATRLAHLRASLSKLCSSAEPLSLCTCMTCTCTHRRWINPNIAQTISKNSVQTFGMTNFEIYFGLVREKKKSRSHILVPTSWQEGLSENNAFKKKKPLHFIIHIRTTVGPLWGPCGLNETQRWKLSDSQSARVETSSFTFDTKMSI